MKEITPLWDYLLLSTQRYKIFERNPNPLKRATFFTFSDFFILLSGKYR